MKHKLISSGTSPLKEMIVEYVGEKMQPQDNEVTYEMVVGLLAEEFPEVVMLLAEENFLLGYQVAMEDKEMDYVEEIHN